MQELEKIDEWGGVDLFKIATLSNNRPLTCVMYTICQVGFFLVEVVFLVYFFLFNLINAFLQKRDMFNKFKLPKERFLTYVMTLEEHYKDVPYHNRIHAADVAQSVHSLLSIPSLKVGSFL